MMNNENMTLTLTRRDICDLRIAITHIIIDMKNELRDEATGECRKEILERSMTKWEKLKAEIVKQFDEQDGE